MLEEKRLTWTEIHLDALRALAALIVVIGHARGLFFSASFTGGPVAQIAIQSTAAETVPQTAWIPTAPSITIGHAAVMIFFVLSGYLVGGSVLKSIASGTWSWRIYLTKRLVRLWLVLIPAVIIGLCIDSIGYHFLAWPDSLYSCPPGQEYALNWYFTGANDIKTALGNILFLQGLLVPLAGTNLALWSLSLEFWYYLLFPMIVLAARSDTPMMARMLCALGIVGILLLIGLHGSYLFLIWVLGAAVSIVPRRIPVRLAPWAVLIAAGLLACFSAAAKKLALNYHAGEMLVALASALLVYAIRCHATIGIRSIYSGASHFFSKISYTLYLTHLPFVIFLTNLVNSPWSLSPPTPIVLGKFAIVIAAAILWSYALYLMFEAKTDSVRAAVASMITRVSGDRDAKQTT